MSARYTPISQLLPTVYQVDANSFDQIDSYLGLADELLRAYAERIEDFTSWLSPNGAVAQWPLDVAPSSGVDPLVGSVLRLYDELASWTGFAFPAWWTVDFERGGETETWPDLDQRRRYLLRAARVWRRRGTPRGFLDWLVLAFSIEQDYRPYLLEHFKFGRPGCADTPPDEQGPSPELRATLLVPSTAEFDRPERRRLLEAFVETYAPAHVHVRVCWVSEAFELYEVEIGTETEVRPIPGPRPIEVADLPAWQAEVDAFTAHIRCILCSLVGETTHATGIQIADCIDEGEAKDRLGIGRLPGGGTVITEDSPTEDSEDSEDPER